MKEQYADDSQNAEPVEVSLAGSWLHTNNFLKLIPQDSGWEISLTCRQFLQVIGRWAFQIRTFPIFLPLKIQTEWQDR
jgi:hypothetical protein